MHSPVQGVIFLFWEFGYHYMPTLMSMGHSFSSMMESSEKRSLDSLMHDLA